MRKENALGLLETAHGDRLARDTSNDIERSGGSRVFGTPGVRRGVDAIVVRAHQRFSGIRAESPAALATAALGGPVDRTAGRANHVVGGFSHCFSKLRCIDENELLRADVHAIHVGEAARCVDSNPVYGHSVTAAEIFDHDRVRTDVEHCVLSRNQPVGKSEITRRASSYRELAERHFEIGRLISQPEPRHDPRASM